MIEFLYTLIFEGLFELIDERWTKHMKKKNPDYDNTRSKKIMIGIFKFLIVIIITIILIGIILLIEWLFPDLLDIISFD